MRVHLDLDDGKKFYLIFKFESLSGPLRCSRICAGRHIAEASIYIAVVMSLAALKIDKARDEDGREIVPVYEATDGMLR